MPGLLCNCQLCRYFGSWCSQWKVKISQPKFWNA